MIMQLLAQVKQWAEEEPSVESVILVGSYARGMQSAESDVDFCIITREKEHLLQNQRFGERFGTVLKRQLEFYGKCTSVRVWYSTGLEAEFGIVDPSWIALPLDAGTVEVLKGGYRVLVDKKGWFEGLILP
jgi:putative toxin-antitoxin system, toxin component